MVLRRTRSAACAVNLQLETTKDLKLEKLWDLDCVFMNKNGSQVRFSQLVGKRIIVLSPVIRWNAGIG